MKKHILEMLLLLLPVWIVANDCEGEGTTGAQFLGIGVGARACAMGEAYGAIADDPSAVYWNPAGLGQARSVEFMVNQNFWLIDMSYQHAAGVFPTRFGNFGISLSYSSSGDIPKIENFLRVGKYAAYDGAMSIAYAQKLMSSLFVGVAGKCIFEKIEDESASTLAADIGLLYRLTQPPGLQFAVVLQNLGPEIKFIEEADPLPFNIKVGAAYLNDGLAFSAEMNKTVDSKFKLGFGGEYVIMQTLALRMGCCTAHSLSVGLGIFWKYLELDYAFVPYKGLDSSHRVSLKFEL